MKTNKTFTKTYHWLLTGLLTLLGFAGCNLIPAEEYGVPHADYTVKGAVVNKATGKAIEGIRVGYYPQEWSDLFGTPPEYYYGPKDYVITNQKSQFTLTAKDASRAPLSLYIEDIDGEKNGLFQPEKIEVDFSKAVHTGKSKHWYEGEYTITISIALDEIVVD